MLMPCTLSSTPLPALLDRVVFAVRGEIADPGNGVAGLAGRLVRAGVCRPGSHSPVRLPVSLSSIGKLLIDGHLKLNKSSTGTVFIEGELSTNAMTALRTQLAMHRVPALDGNVNYIGPCDDKWPGYLQLQLDALGNAFEAVLARVLSAASSKGGELRLALRACEVCRDIHHTDARALTWRLANSSAPSGLAQVSQVYKCAPKRETVGDSVTLRWSENLKKGNVYCKVYAKLPDLLRTEVQLQDRHAVCRLLRGVKETPDKWVEASQPAISHLLNQVVICADKHLREIDRFCAEMDGYQTEALEFFLELAPLTSIINPLNLPGQPGRKVAPETREVALNALEALLQVGRCRLPKGLDHRNTVRVALDLMAEGSDACIARGSPRALLYVVQPTRDDARRALARALYGVSHALTAEGE